MASSTPSEHRSVVIANFNVDTPTGTAPVNASFTTEPVDVPKESSRNQISNSAATTTPVEAERTPCNSYSYIPACITSYAKIYILYTYLFTAVNQTDYTKQTYGSSNSTHHGSSDQVASYDITEL